VSLPDSGSLLRIRTGAHTPGRSRFAGAARPGTSYDEGVLSGLRDSSGRPNVRVKVLTVVVALLLAGPLTIVVVRALLAVLELLF
jgi:hypothetical protein